MFPGCPEHCNVEGKLSEYSRNIASRQGRGLICVTSWDVTSSGPHDLDLALKSPNIFLKESLNCLLWFRSLSKLDKNSSNSYRLTLWWIHDNSMTSLILECNFTSSALCNKRVFNNFFSSMFFKIQADTTSFHIIRLISPN